MDALDEPGYPAIYPTHSPHPEYSTILIESQLLPQYSIYQDVDMVHPCLISSATSESDPVALQVDSRYAFNDLHSRAEKSVKDVYIQNKATNIDATQVITSQCGFQSHLSR